MVWILQIVIMISSKATSNHDDPILIHISLTLKLLSTSLLIRTSTICWFGFLVFPQLSLTIIQTESPTPVVHPTLNCKHQIVIGFYLSASIRKRSASNSTHYSWGYDRTLKLPPSLLSNNRSIQCFNLIKSYKTSRKNKSDQKEYEFTLQLATKSILLTPWNNYLRHGRFSEESPNDQSKRPVSSNAPK